MKVYRTETLIIGAGPAGLACAMELSKKQRDFIVIEKDSQSGGLSKTYRFEESDGSVFFTDNGPHRFFSKNQYLNEFIGDILKDDLVTVKRHTRQYINGKYYDYPVKALQAFKNIGLRQSVLILIDYVYAKIQFNILRRPIQNFRDYIEAHFGKRLGEFNMINYTEKIWGIKAEYIHQDWAKQRIKGLDLRTIIFDQFKKIRNLNKNKTASLIDSFYYPAHGSGEVYEKIVETLVAKKYECLFDCTVTEVKRTLRGFETIMTRDSETVIIYSTYLVESVPITQFVTLLQPVPPRSVISDMTKLTYRSQVYLFITLNKESLSPDQWIYLPNKEIPFGRISEMRNFSKHMSPSGKTSLFIEFFCTEDDSIWNMSKEDLFELTIPHIEKMGLFERKDVRNVYLLKQKNAYPVYDLIYTEHLEHAISYLDSIKNLFAIGRPGRFRYNNQDHSLEMGIIAARSIIEGKRYDLNTIDGDYFEKGYLQTKVK